MEFCSLGSGSSGNSFIVKKNNKYLKIILEKAKMNSFKLINIPKNNLRKYLNYGLTL